MVVCNTWEFSFAVDYIYQFLLNSALIWWAPSWWKVEGTKEGRANWLRWKIELVKVPMRISGDISPVSSGPFTSTLGELKRASLKEKKKIKMPKWKNWGASTCFEVSQWLALVWKPCQRILLEAVLSWPDWRKFRGDKV